jgi:fused signal recognition particle receptor
MEYLAFVIAIAVVGVAVVAALLLRSAPPSKRSGRATTRPTSPRGAGGPGRTPTPTPTVGDDATVPRDTPTRMVDTVTLPDDGALAAPAAGVAAGIDVIDPTAGRMVRLRARLSRSSSTLGKGLLTLLSRDRLDDETWDEIEEVLLGADMGVRPTQELVASLQMKVRVLGARTPDEVRALLRDELLAQIGSDTDRTLATEKPREAGKPAVVLVVGVNGTGKTTTCGKLARVLVADGHTVVLAAADTFRAAAADQLETWGARVGATTVRGPEAGDPASVAFDAVAKAIETGADTVLVDTAGRLHTKTGLMDELGKVKRVIEKHGPVDEVLLVLDATTGQNAVVQARVFTEVVQITGVVLTKLDGTAKGGIVVAVQRELGVPVKLVGLGEGPDDLAPFEPEAFVDALLSDELVG